MLSSTSKPASDASALAQVRGDAVLAHVHAHFERDETERVIRVKGCISWLHRATRVPNLDQIKREVRRLRGVVLVEPVDRRLADAESDTPPGRIEVMDSS